MIRIDDRNERDLTWYFGGEFEGQMGRQSPSGGTIDTLERGFGLHAKLDAHGRMIDRLALAERHRKMEHRLSVIAPSHRCMLAAGFERKTSAIQDKNGEFVAHDASGLFPFSLTQAPEDAKPGKEHPANYCRAVLASVSARKAFWKETEIWLPVPGYPWRGAPTELEQWLTSLALDSSWAKKKRDPHQPRARKVGTADAMVNSIKLGVEEEFVAALVGFGASVEGVTLPRDMSLRQIAEKLGLSDKTVKSELVRRGVHVAEQERGKACKIGIKALRFAWPDLVAAVAIRSASESRA